MNQIKNEGNNINNQIFGELFYYWPPSSLAESSYDDNQIKNNTIAKNVNDALINLRNDANKKNS